MLADPEHQNSLDWLGLGSASEFDPAAFDTPAITKALSKPALTRAAGHQSSGHPEPDLWPDLILAE